MGKALKYVTVLLVPFTALYALVTCVGIFRMHAGSRQQLLQQELEYQKLIISQFLEQPRAIGKQVASRTRAREALEAYNGGTIDHEQFQETSQYILSDALRQEAALTSIFRFDKGEKLAVQVGTPLLESLWIFPNGEQALHGPAIVNGTPHVLVTTPIVNREGEKVGSDLTAYSMESLQASLSKRSSASEARHYLLLDKERNEPVFTSPDLPSEFMSGGGLTSKILELDVGKSGSMAWKSDMDGWIVGSFSIAGTSWEFVDVSEVQSIGRFLGAEIGGWVAVYLVLMFAQIVVMRIVLARVGPELRA